MEKIWYAKKLDEIYSELKSGESGLSLEEASDRISQYGFNEFPEAKPDGIFVIFLRQFKSPLIFILLFVSMIVYAMGDLPDALIILGVLVFNSVVGSIQEGRAQNVLLSLKKYVGTKTAVLRNGEEIIVDGREVVLGDIVVLQEGEKIPADCRIIQSHNFKVDESSLTGESIPVEKNNKVQDGKDLQIGDQKNMIFKGTNIVTGNAKAIVVATGLESVIGKIAKEISLIDTEIPLKANIRYLSRAIVMAVFLISSVLFVAGIVQGKEVKEMFLTVVSLSVSVIPEGLPIVMTLVLATGVWRMSKRNALVKRLQAVEALGQARVIAVDKTGTLTKNEMTVHRVFTEGEFYDIKGSGYEPKGEVFLNGNVIDPANHPPILFAGKISALSSNAKINFSKDTNNWKIAGDPTEAAMHVFAEKIGFHKYVLEKEYPLVAEIPFDYKLKYHATVREHEGKNWLSVIGAPEVVLKLCEKVCSGGKCLELTSEKRKELELAFHSMSKDGLRVIAIAEEVGFSIELNPEKIKGLSFVGFLGLRDSLRPEAKKAVLLARDAGIKVVMITGDHKITAEAVAREANIFKDGNRIIAGEDLDSMNDEDLKNALVGTTVFARVTPEHKLRIIKAYKNRGEIVAMTGDGVNDAPSLVAADLGVSMGKIGTEVAKEASDIILLDDNFGSIVSAIEEGRSIYKTIKKVILYLFSTSVGEVFAISGAIFLGLPLPILPAQIIWLNFVTDGFLDVALSMEPKEKGLLSGTFERPKKYLVDRLMIVRIILVSLPMSIGALYLFKGYFEYDIAKAWTISLTVLAAFQWFNAWNCRSENKSIFEMNPFSNRFLVGATFIVVSLQVLAVYNPFLQKLLSTVPLSFKEWMLVLLVALTVVLVEEVRKLGYRFYANRSKLASIY